MRDLRTQAATTCLAALLACGSPDSPASPGTVVATGWLRADSEVEIDRYGFMGIVLVPAGTSSSSDACAVSRVSGWRFPDGKPLDVEYVVANESILSYSPPTYEADWRVIAWVASSTDTAFDWYMVESEVLSFPVGPCGGAMPECASGVVDVDTLTISRRGPSCD